MSDVAPAAPDGFEAVARTALAEVTPPDTVGELLAAQRSAEDVTDLEFASTVPGYVGWRWTVSMTRLPDEEPSVLEVEMLPGDGSLLAPPWVPWAERLAEYRRTHPDEADVLDDADDEDELDELDEDDLDPDDVLDDADADDELDGIDFEATAVGDDAADDDDDDEALADDDLEDDEPSDDDPSLDEDDQDVDEDDVEEPEPDEAQRPQG